MRLLGFGYPDIGLNDAVSNARRSGDLDPHQIESSGLGDLAEIPIRLYRNAL